MPAYNFHQQFSDLVFLGLKKQTFRTGKPRCKVGETIRFYTGQRTKLCTYLGHGLVRNISSIIVDVLNGAPYITVNGELLNHLQVEDFARKDGFANAMEFLNFIADLYEHKLPIYGHCIEWELLP